MKNNEWIQNAFPANIPFSFVYDGKESKKLLKGWEFVQKTEVLDDARTRRVFTYTDSEKHLEVRCEAIIYSDFPAVEWVLYFKNTGKVDTPIIENIQALDAIFPSEGEYNVHRILGNSSTAADFAPVVNSISHGMNLVTGCHGGRSSCGGDSPSELGGCVPFFNLEEVGAERGIITAVGWTGQWFANFNHETESTIHVTAGMEFTHLKLLPGERIRAPGILLLFWEGPDYLIGNNLLRRFIVAHKLPRINGEPIEVPIGANTFFKHVPACPAGWGVWGVPSYADNALTEQNQIAHARRCKELGIEYYWLDAGWFEGGWPMGAGNWFVKKDGFPAGLKGLSNALKEMGVKFILWFEPERVVIGTQLWREHPEWLVGKPKLPTGRIQHCERISYNYSLLNLGNPEARKWLTEHISGMITEYGIDVYRQDFNVDPLQIWRSADAEDRKGITEIHHIEGLYAFWDELLSRHSGLIIDCVASGDRRIDIETISRSTTLTRSDYVCEPIGAQCITYGLNLFMPGHVGLISGAKVDKYRFRSVLSGGAGICWDLEQEDFPDDYARMLIKEAKQLRPLFYGDFWPLTPYSLSKNCWIAWQFDRPDLGSGAAFAFRRSKAAENRIKLFLKGLKPESMYEIMLVDTDTKKAISGKELMEKGMEVSEDNAPSSMLITYKLMNS